MKLTVIIPTIGRESLQAALSSCANADEVIVVEDNTGDHGYTARMKGMAQATGTHLVFLDDDDVWADGASQIIRWHESSRPVIFRMDDPLHGVIWRFPRLEFGNVGTPMFVVPNDPDRLGVWEPYMPELRQPGGDFTFITGCVKNMGNPVWREEVIAVVAPEARRLPSIAVVTPWLDHRELEAAYFAAVKHALYENDEMIVVDNGSDPRLPYAKVRFSRNEGFHKACNAGLAAATTDAVLFLNNDIAATRPDWLHTIRLALEPGVLVGNLSYAQHGDVDGHQLPYIDGWCLAGMRDDLLELGGFDESFDEPAYFGDNDLCLRARVNGMTLKQADVGLVHLTNRTAGPAETPAVRQATEANRRRFAERAREALEGAPA